MRILSVLALALLLPACSDASVPLATAEADFQGKKFSPAPDRGTVYFYRESKIDSIFKLWVATGQHTLGALAPRTWFRIDLDPGRYIFLCAPFEWALKYSGPMIVPHIPTIIQVEAGEIYFVEVGVDRSRSRCVGVETTPEKGRAAVLVSRRAGEPPGSFIPTVAKPMAATPAGPISIIYRDDATNERSLTGVARYSALLGRDHSVPFIVENENAQQFCDGTFTQDGPTNGTFTLSCINFSGSGIYERKTGDRHDSFIARGQTSRGFPITLVIGRPASTADLRKVPKADSR